MENGKKNIDDLFKDGLGSYTETPPPPVWGALEKRLDRGIKPVPGFSYRRLWSLALLCGLLLLSIPIVKKLAAPSTQGANNIAANENKASQVNTPASNKNTGTNNAPAPGDNGTQSKNNETTATENNKPGNNDPSQAANTNNKTKTGQKGKQIVSNKNTTHSLAKTKNKTLNGNKTTETQEQPENVYNSHISNPAPNEATGENEKNGTIDQKQTKDIAKNKENKQQDNKQDQKKNPEKVIRPKFSRFEAGIKCGYETGFDNDAAKKAVISPYLQYNISRKFSIMLQPSVKEAQIQARRIGAPKSYYKENADSSITNRLDPYLVQTPFGTYNMYHFYYSQTHDSIVKTNSIGSTYMEFELPVLLKYYIAKNFSVYGGVNITYSNLVGVAEHTYTGKNILRTDSAVQLVPIGSPVPAPQFHVNDRIMYDGIPYSSYAGPQYPTPQGGLLRFGYMIGFSYECNKRWLFDALVQQGSVKTNVQGGYNINSALSAPYIRLTLGYKLIKL